MFALNFFLRAFVHILAFLALQNVNEMFANDFVSAGIGILEIILWALFIAEVLQFVRDLIIWIRSKIQKT